MCSPTGLRKPSTKLGFEYMIALLTVLGTGLRLEEIHRTIKFGG
jgi:hypothetical protein